MADVTEQPYLFYHSWTLLYVHGYEFVMNMCIRVWALQALGCGWRWVLLNFILWPCSWRLFFFSCSLFRI